MRTSNWIILAIGIAFAAYVFHSLARTEPVEVIQTRLEHQGGKVFVAGQVKNTGSSARTIDLEVHYYDRNGRPVGEDALQLNALGVGEVAAFKSPPHTLDGVADFSIYLNHGRNPYGN